MSGNDKQVDGTSVADTDEVHEAQHLNDNGAYPYANCSRCISETGTPYLPPDYGGPVVQCADCGHDAPDEPCKRHEQPDGPLCQPCRLGQLMLHMLCWKCGGNRFLWQRDSAVEYVHIVSFNDEDTPVVDDTSWQTTDGEGTGDTWVSCLYCGTELMRDVDYAIGEATQ